jgi:CHASE1-domain containing sensor protein
MSLAVAMSSDTTDVVLAVSPAVFGLLGTVVGAGVTYRAAVAERRAEEDNQARQGLAAMTDAIHAASRFIRGKSRRAKRASQAHWRTLFARQSQTLARPS